MLNRAAARPILKSSLKSARPNFIDGLRRGLTPVGPFPVTPSENTPW